MLNLSVALQRALLFCMLGCLFLVVAKGKETAQYVIFGHLAAI